MLGWRHDESGACEAEVRVHVDGAVQVRWVDLGSVRLPEPPSVPTVAVPVVERPQVAPGAAPTPAETVVMSRAELRGLLSSGPSAAPAPRRRRHAADLTAEFPVVRCAEPDAGRHRAPATAPTPVVGRHRAGDDTGQLVAVPGSRPGGPESERWTRPIRMQDVAGWPWGDSAASSA
ncbi:hypothetical protein DQ240_13225 [Blastococcus sp. TF02A-26]|nr:hypothetical protein DQ240_13225 [Blastococcus sp. TF02A-26]